MSEGTLRIPFDLIAHMNGLLAAAEAEPDEHRAFHIRSGMPWDAPDALCATCASGGSRGGLDAPTL